MLKKWIENYKRKYALTDKGFKNVLKGTFWTTLVNLLMIGGMGILYFLMNDYMEVLTNNGKMPVVWIYIVALLAFLVASFILHIMQYRNTYGVVYGETRNTRISLAEKLRKLPLGYFSKRDVADLTETLLGDVNKLEHMWSHCLGYLYGAYCSTFIVAIMMFVYDWRLALACLWGVPLAFILLFTTRKISDKHAVNVKKHSIDVSDSIQETIENIREIRLSNQSDKYLDSVYKKIDKTESLHRKNELLVGLIVNSASLIMRLGVATTIITGIALILKGQVNFMVLFMFLMAITRIYAPFDQSLTLIAELFLTQVSARRLREIYETKSMYGKLEFEPKNHDIEFKNVSFGYEKKNVLSNISFTAKEGEITALVGPSGSGKSTCAKLSARLWDVDSGEILVGGINIKDIEQETLLKSYSVVFQDVVLFDDTVMENIRLGKKGASDSEVLNAARLANCDSFVNKLENGYNTMIGENGTKLSGGERQRISIARAILKNASIVLLDEATASLDVENETDVQGALSNLLKDKTVLVIAHRMRTIEKANKVIVLKDGKIAEEGKPEELNKLENGIFKRMVELQTSSDKWLIEK